MLPEKVNAIEVMIYAGTMQKQITPTLYVKYSFRSQDSYAPMSLDIFIFELFLNLSSIDYHIKAKI